MPKFEIEKLRIIHYPDPRLRGKARPVEQFDGELAALAERMHALMREDKGVGLAAPQLGLGLRMFVMNHTGEPGDARTFVNPVIRDKQGAAEAEEGCLSLPGVFVQVRRAASCAIEARDVRGEPIRLEGSELIARVWQHETDHLDGRLIIDRMGPSDALKVKKTLQALEEQYRNNPAGRHDGKVM